MKDTILLQKLGELFIEFFWFIHEIIKLSENEENKDNKNDNNIILIYLNKKIYDKQNIQDFREIEGFHDKPTIRIPISLKLMLYEDNEISMPLYRIDKRQAHFLKKECTRALYFLLNGEGKEMFVFENK